MSTTKTLADHQLADDQFFEKDATVLEFLDHDLHKALNVWAHARGAWLKAKEHTRGRLERIKSFVDALEMSPDNADFARNLEHAEWCYDCGKVLEQRLRREMNTAADALFDIVATARKADGLEVYPNVPISIVADACKYPFGDDDDETAADKPSAPRHDGNGTLEGAADPVDDSIDDD